MAALVAVKIGRRPRRRREPLAFAFVFLAVGLRGLVHALLGDAPALATSPSAVLGTDLPAAAAVAFLVFRRRDGLLVESADMVRGYETAA